MRPRLLAVWALVAVAVLVSTALVVRIARHDQFTIDTVVLIEGTHQAADCVRAGELTRCGYDPLTDKTSVWAFPILQYVPTAGLVALHVDDATSRDVLMWLDLLAVVAAVAIVAERAWKRGGAPLAVLGLVGMTSGMLVAYAGASFGEPLVVLALVVACRLALARAPTFWLAVAAALATIGKETMFPVVALCVVGFICFARDDRRVRRSKVWWAAGGIVAGVAVNTAFNVFRFGTWRNLQYFAQGRRPGIVGAAENTISLLAAPNAGMLWFWFAAAAAGVALVAVVICTGSRLERIGALAVLAALAVGVATAALWWMPFGWYSWGPRFLLVPLAPVVFAAVETWPTIASRAAWGAASAVVVVALLLMVSPLGFVFEPETSWMNQWIVTTNEHPECTPPDRRTVEGAGVHHACLMRAAWRTDVMPLIDGVTEASERDGVWYWSTVGGVAVLGIAGLLVIARRRPVGAPDAVEPADPST